MPGLGRFSKVATVFGHECRKFRTRLGLKYIRGIYTLTKMQQLLYALFILNCVLGDPECLIGQERMIDPDMSSYICTCVEGMQSSTTNGCELCPVNTFKKKWSLPDKCLPCTGTTHTYASTGAITCDQCCNGMFLDATGDCSGCPTDMTRLIQIYNENTISFLTQTSHAFADLDDTFSLICPKYGTDVADFLQARNRCAAGNYLDEQNMCQQCAEGKYKNQDDTQCIPSGVCTGGTYDQSIELCNTANVNCVTDNQVAPTKWCYVTVELNSPAIFVTTPRTTVFGTCSYCENYALLDANMLDTMQKMWESGDISIQTGATTKCQASCQSGSYIESGCMDIAFKDSDGLACSAYIENPQWCNTASDYTNAKTGVHAGQACCICGGGDISSNTETPQKCVACTAGKYIENTMKSCQDCAAGKYSQEGSVLCTDCLSGKFSPAAASTCTDCCYVDQVYPSSHAFCNPRNTYLSDTCSV